MNLWDFELIDWDEEDDEKGTSRTAWGEESTKSWSQRFSGKNLSRLRCAS